MLDILEVEDDTVALEKHLVNQIPLEADLMLLEWLCELTLEITCIQLLLICEIVIYVTYINLVQ